MKLHVLRASQNCRRPISVAAHLELDVELVDVDMSTGGHKQPAFLALNPNGKVPVLEADGYSLWEGTAIANHFAEGTALMPAGKKERAQVNQWQQWEGRHLGPRTDTFDYQNLVKPKFFNQEPDAAVVEKAAKGFHAVAPVLDTHLANHDWIVGADLSVADFCLGANFQYAAFNGLPWQDYANIQRWYARLSETKGWQSSQPSFG